jgi:DNA-binding NarL/FixJ family response regulator
MKSLVLIADRPAVARALRLALRRATGFRVADIVDGRGSCRDALRADAPDVVIVDELCQRANVLARLREARAELGEASIVLLSTGMDRPALESAFSAGADAVMSRRLKGAAFSTVLHEVVHGTVVNTPHQASGRRPAPVLDPIDRELMRLVAQGLPVERVAETLALPRHAVDARLQAVVRVLAGPEILRGDAQALDGSVAFATLRSA